MADNIEYELLADGTLTGYHVKHSNDETQHESATGTPAIDKNGKSHPDFFNTSEHPDATTLYAHQQDQGWGVQDASDRLVYGHQASFQQKPFEYSIAPEVYYYSYKETEDSQQVMQNTGTFVGFKTALAWNLVTPVYIPDSLRFEGRLAAGLIKYEGQLQDLETGKMIGNETVTNVKDWTGEARALIGKRIPIADMAQMMPYAGIGYRYLEDKQGEIPAKKNILSGYDRESRYFYIPIGSDVVVQFHGGWGLGINLEYDYLVNGRQTSHFEQWKDTSGTTYGFPSTVSQQKKGFGLRGSFRISKEMSTDKYSVYVEPYYRLWHIDQSEEKMIYGTLHNQYGYFVGHEPRNETQETGIQVGVNF